LATLIGTAGLLVSTAARAQDISYDYDKTANFAAHQTYAWVNGHPLGDEINDQRIMAAVERQLEAKGVRKAEAIAGADLLVTYHAVVSQDVRVEASRLGPRWASARAERVAVGALLVELTDARTHAVIWRGVASRDLNPKASPEQREKNINQAVEKLFKHYPPEA
jgi:hypothetical protein